MLLMLMLPCLFGWERDRKGEGERERERGDIMLNFIHREGGRRERERERVTEGVVNFLPV